MSKPRLEWKVGFFVIVSLVLFAGLVIKFSKGSSLLVSTYMVNLKAEDVGGIIPGAVVLMAGVPIGNVVATDLDNDGKHVTIRVKLLKKYRIYRDAIFGIKQAGFLGDRFISVVPTENRGPVLKEGDEVSCEAPFDLTEVARSTSGLIKRVDETIQQLNTAVGRIDRTLLAADTLTNLTGAFSNFRLLSEQTLSTFESVDRFVRSNTPGLSGSVSNLADFTLELNKGMGELRATISSNRSAFGAAVANLEQSTARLNELVGGVQEGKGLAGNLLRNEELSVHVSLIASNLAVLSSNMNNKGLWATLRKPKQTSTTSKSSSKSH